MTARTVIGEEREGDGVVMKSNSLPYLDKRRGRFWGEAAVVKETFKPLHFIKAFFNIKSMN